jgi:hypothetical protein
MASRPDTAFAELVLELRFVARRFPEHRITAHADAETLEDAVATTALLVATGCELWPAISVIVPGGVEGERGAMLGALVPRLTTALRVRPEETNRSALFRVPNEAGACVLDVYERDAEEGAPAELVTVRCEVDADRLYIFVDTFSLDPPASPPNE